MLERRAARRRRVCLEGAITSDLAGPISTVRVRNLSAGGAEIVVPEGQLSSPDLELTVERADMRRRARVVWRRMNRFGLKFGAAQPSDGEEAALSPSSRTTTASSLLADFLSARRAGRKK